MGNGLCLMASLENVIVVRVDRVYREYHRDLSLVGIRVMYTRSGFSCILKSTIRGSKQWLGFVYDGCAVFTMFKNQDNNISGLSTIQTKN